MKINYIIGTGWWCNESNIALDKDNRVTYGDNEIRGSLFQKKWIKSVVANSNPIKVVISDSNSPTPPPNLDFHDIEYIKLNENAGHGTNHTGELCGWSRGMLMSATYAANCDCDYYVYIEQDVLLKGKGIIEHAISTMNKPYMFGTNKGMNQPLQQSFFIIKKTHLSQFIAKYLTINYRDDEIVPEVKFALCTSPLFWLIPKCLFNIIKPGTLIGRITYRAQMLASKWLSNFNSLPFGEGRDRPLDFSQEFLYFQHASKEELTEFEKSSL